jgi:2-oxoglutarate/2-oxoacid ferredoxin oxidoreductase subunit beta
MNAPEKLTAKDFATDQEVRWCPGCGDYAILKSVQRTLADIGADPSNTVFVSGIGCSSRFPYYMETYGFHTIHGRAPAIATGIKIANPELDLWLVSGDGDSMSIGGNHLLHILRRNVDLVYLLLNNEIYGLTKGQMSPTSRLGTKSPTSPRGSADKPVHALRFALGAGASFVARSIDVNAKHLMPTLSKAHAHKGTSFVEILQDCIVFNHGIFDNVTDKKSAVENLLFLEHGAPMIWGPDKDRGLTLDIKTLTLKAVTIGENGVSESDILVHDETNLGLAQMLATIVEDDMPTPIGVFFRSEEETLEGHCHAPDAEQAAVRGKLENLMKAGNTWQVD